MAAGDSSLNDRQSAIAYFHAAEAYNSLGDHAAAAKAIEASYSELSENDSWLKDPTDGANTDANAKLKMAAARFRLERAMTSAAANQALADMGRFSATPSCSTRSNCLSTALGRMASAQDALAPFRATASQPPATIYDNYQLQLARMHRARATPADYEPAISAYQDISTRQPVARNELAAFASQLGSEAAARPDAGSATLAIRYFTIARDVSPSDAVPEIGLGQTYIKLGQSADDIGQYQAAETAFSRALQKATTTGQEAEAYVGRGTARDAIATLRGTSRDAALKDFEEAAARASSGDTYLILARAYKSQENWATADDYFTKAMSALMSEGVSGERLSQAYLDQAAVRTQVPTYSTTAVRSLLDNAVRANPGSAIPLMQRAEFDISSGNWEQAKTDLRRIVNTGSGSALEDALDYQDEAYGLLSTAYAASQPANLSAAIANAEEAVERNNSELQYRMQACIARIMMGGAAITGEDAPAKCTLGSAVEDLMLQSMYTMRRAELTRSARTAGSIRSDIRSDTNRAMNQVSDSDVTNFGWPVAGSAPSAKTKAILIYQREAALSCNGGFALELPSDLGMSRADYSAAENFLAFYGANKC